MPTMEDIKVSEAKWTPGPWQFEIQENNGYAIYDSEGNCAGFASGDNDLQCLAHARLIAAAPDLYELLDTLRRQWESIPENAPVPDEINDNDTWGAVRAALAKARGDNQGKE